MKDSATQTGSNDLLWNVPKCSSIWKSMRLNIKTWTLNTTLYTPGICVPWCNILCEITVTDKFFTNECHYFAELLCGVCWVMFTFYFSFFWCVRVYPEYITVLKTLHEKVALDQVRLLATNGTISVWLCSQRLHKKTQVHHQLCEV